MNADELTSLEHQGHITIIKKIESRSDGTLRHLDGSAKYSDSESLTASIDDVSTVDCTENAGWAPVWNTGSPVGCEFGTDSARFTRSLQPAIAIFCNPLDAVRWPVFFNAIAGDEPMKLVIRSEEDRRRVIAILSAIET
jgi:hypothetical protein